MTGKDSLRKGFFEKSPRGDNARLVLPNRALNLGWEAFSGGFPALFRLGAGAVLGIWSDA